MAAVGLCAFFLSAITGAIYDGNFAFARSETTSTFARPATVIVTETVNNYIPHVVYVNQIVEAGAEVPIRVEHPSSPAFISRHFWLLVGSAILAVLTIVFLILLWRRYLSRAAAISTPAADYDGTDDSNERPVETEDAGDGLKELSQDGLEELSQDGLEEPSGEKDPRPVSSTTTTVDGEPQSTGHQD